LAKLISDSAVVFPEDSATVAGCGQRCFRLIRSVENSVGAYRKSLTEVTMKKSTLAVFVSLFSLASAAFAQNVTSGEIQESTDPAKISAIEQHAMELQQQQAQSGQETSGASGTEGTAPQHKPKHRHHMKKKHQGKSGAKQSAPASSGSSSSGSSESGAGAPSSAMPSEQSGTQPSGGQQSESSK
jgi:hypothetical protein